MMKFQESSIWNSLSIPLLICSSLTTFLLVYFHAKGKLTVLDLYAVGQTVIIQTVQLLGFYLSNIWYASMHVTLLQLHALTLLRELH